MSKWKPVGNETWRKRKKRKFGAGFVVGPARFYRAPVGTLAEWPSPAGAWKEIGRAQEGFLRNPPDGWQVQTFGPGALHDCVVFIGPPRVGKSNPSSYIELPDSWNA